MTWDWLKPKSFWHQNPTFRWKVSISKSALATKLHFIRHLKSDTVARRRSLERERVPRQFAKH